MELILVTLVLLVRVRGLAASQAGARVGAGPGTINAQFPPYLGGSSPWFPGKSSLPASHPHTD